VDTLEIDSCFSLDKTSNEDPNVLAKCVSNTDDPDSSLENCGSFVRTGKSTDIITGVPIEEENPSYNVLVPDVSCGHGVVMGLPRDKKIASPFLNPFRPTGLSVLDTDEIKSLQEVDMYNCDILLRPLVIQGSSNQFQYLFSIATKPGYIDEELSLYKSLQLPENDFESNFRIKFVIEDDAIFPKINANTEKFFWNYYLYNVREYSYHYLMSDMQSDNNRGLMLELFDIGFKKFVSSGYQLILHVNFYEQERIWFKAIDFGEASESISKLGMDLVLREFIRYKYPDLNLDNLSFDMPTVKPTMIEFTETSIESFHVFTPFLSLVTREQNMAVHVNHYITIVPFITNNVTSLFDIARSQKFDKIHSIEGLFTTWCKLVEASNYASLKPIANAMKNLIQAENLLFHMEDDLLTFAYLALTFAVDLNYEDFMTMVYIQAVANVDIGGGLYESKRFFTVIDEDYLEFYRARFNQLGLNMTGSPVSHCYMLSDYMNIGLAPNNICKLMFDLIDNFYKELQTSRPDVVKPRFVCFWYKLQYFVLELSYNSSSSSVVGQSIYRLCSLFHDMLGSTIPPYRICDGSWDSPDYVQVVMKTYVDLVDKDITLEFPTVLDTYMAGFFKNHVKW